MVELPVNDKNDIEPLSGMLPEVYIFRMGRKNSFGCPLHVDRTHMLRTEAHMIVCDVTVGFLFLFTQQYATIARMCT